ncbi:MULTISPECIES: type I secretion system permease/ATPase [unclassified Pseudomonas]|uniref:type I secretion system permease/ATPase n=1 Tax=unclassified Pseudomonas TaxID=196821 RepID=UPI00194274ED|nr:MULTISPECIES: type I secretion system permease/ATPase [unclassified Pseudomonas]MCE0913726.1 type I secretion system permease/ATPase [Pseudomonas sp. NMI760_13]MCP8635575.1 type I secretion system permease/ATPase [Pseudomonas sp. DVZ6]MDC0690470.1 type I secretion system permease/ATPase [Mitsuaria sp. RG]MCF1490419.1 type I secretion system permease/ATPase [Pseudomonas sp. AA27]MDD7786075.1 type I secretion system permease/ATPase [Pseudomonas sp. DVZ24]
MESEVSRVQLSHDPRSQHDDPLLDSLLTLCVLHQKPASRAMLTTGLPLPSQRLTAELLPRAAARAGLQGRLLQRKLEQIPSIAMPAMLLLKEGRCAVLLGWENEDTARLLLSESDGGEVHVTREALQGDYSGKVFFAQPQHKFDVNHGNLIPRARSWFRDTLLRSKWLYIDAIAASLVINLIALAAPLFVMNVYDRVVPNQATSTLWVLAVGIAGAYVFDLILKGLRSLCLDLAGKKTDLIISATLFERIVGMSMKYRPARVGSFAQNIHEFQGLRDFLASLTLTSLIDLPFTLLILMVIAIIGGHLVWIPILAFPLALGIGYALQKPLMATMERTMALASERQSSLIETLAGLDAVKVNNAESERQYMWEQTLGTLSRLELRVKVLSGLAMNITALIQQLAGVAMICVGVYLIIDGNLSMGGLVACYMLSGRALGPLGSLNGLLARYQQAKVTMVATDQMMELPQERNFEERPLSRQVLQGAIEFRGVEFTYPNQQNQALKGINLNIRPGEKVGIIGRSGSGKSSLAKLIVGLYEPDNGSLLVDGVDIRQIDVSELRHNIGYVPQDIQLLAGTLRDNLVSGARYIEDELILQAAELAGVHEFARLHPDGYELQVGERGQNLSGGQRQNVALGRALLLNPQILLLDEPTSAMDNTGEERLKQRLAAVIENKTVLLVTHRASLLSLVDRLIVIDRGQIVADGPKAAVMDALKKGQISVA